MDLYVNPVGLVRSRSFSAARRLLLLLFLTIAFLLLSSSSLPIYGSPVLAEQLPAEGRIAFRRLPVGDGRSEIYVIDPDGSDQQLVSTSAADWWPTWAPDGQHIAFANNHTGNMSWEISMMNIDGTELTNLTDNTFSDNSPSWSYDGTKIAFMQILGEKAAPATLSSVTLQQESPTEAAHYLRASTILSLTITDAQGVEYPPQVSFYQLSDGSYAVVLPRSETFTATIVLKDSQPGQLDLRTGTDEATSHTIRYQDLAPAGNRQLQLQIGPQGFAPLQRDANADGVFETLVSPTIDVTGADANDNQAPVLAITSDSQTGMIHVTITATDTTGVKQIWYSLDGSTFHTYSEPLDLSLTDATQVYAFAEDTLANRSGLLRKDLLINYVYLPLLQRAPAN